MKMEPLKVYAEQDLLKLTRIRAHETKLGEKVAFSKTQDWKKELAQSGARFVLIGIAEDIGVRANQGRAGASSAVKPAMDSFLNQQSNPFLDATSVFVLGEIYVEDLMEKAMALDQKTEEGIKGLRKLVEHVDERVTGVLKEIFSMNKIPLIVGGGHNNAYGNIKAAALAAGHAVNVINCDPHLDFRPAEGRHSGNGFTYAHAEGHLKKYAVLCMHEQYNNELSIRSFREQPGDLHYISYESVFIREENTFEKALDNCISFVRGNACGLELDLDAITNVPSSAKTSSGITDLQARRFVYSCAKKLKPLYFHIAEGAPVLSHIKADNKTGKLIAYLLSDFIKACQSLDD
jgi:formiminoglutamase